MAIKWEHSWGSGPAGVCGWIACTSPQHDALHSTEWLEADVNADFLESQIGATLFLKAVLYDMQHHFCHTDASKICQGLVRIRTENGHRSEDPQFFFRPNYYES